MKHIKKFESKRQKGLFYWAEPIDDSSSWHIVSQVKGYPAIEAHDDWFAHKKDAEEIAEAMANETEALPIGE